MLAYFRSKAALQREIDEIRKVSQEVYWRNADLKVANNQLQKEVTIVKASNAEYKTTLDRLSNQLERALKDHALEKEVIMRALDGIGSALIQRVKA